MQNELRSRDFSFISGLVLVLSALRLGSDQFRLQQSRDQTKFRFRSVIKQSLNYVNTDIKLKLRSSQFELKLKSWHPC